MLIGYKRGQGSIVLRVKILNSSVATGAGLTGLSSASSGLIISTIADNEASATTYTVAGSTIESITTLGTFAAPTATKCRFKEVDATNHKGVCEIQIADARYAVSSAKSLLVSISGATNAAETDVVIPLRDLDPYDSVRAGLTALPNAAAGANTGLPVVGTQVPNATAGATNGLFIAGTNAATTITTGLTTTFTGNLTGSVASVTAGVTLAASAVQAIWDAATSALTTVGSIGKLLVDNINATISSRMATYTQPTGFLAASFPASPAAVGSAMTLTSGERDSVADAMLDRTAGVETNRTPRQALRLMLAAMVGKLSGAATTTVVIRDTNDLKDRISATVDSNGNRSAVTLDGS